MKAALSELLKELRPGDLFNVVAFSSTLRYWNDWSIAPATADNVHSAKAFVGSLSSTDGLRSSVYFESHACPVVQAVV